MAEEHTVKQLQNDLNALGIEPGDVVLMHSSYKSLGGIEDGAAGFYRGFLDLLGKKGTLVLPTLSFRSVQAGGTFHVRETPACVGYLPEYFRTNVEGVRRSLHPTHSCSAVGAAAEYMTTFHEYDHTPVGANSPFRKMPTIGGKLLMLGCGLGPCTSMHGVEETVMPPYLLTPQQDPYTIIDYEGKTSTMYVHRHAFNINGYAQRYARLEKVLTEGTFRRGKVLNADCWLVDTAALWRIGHRAMLDDPFFFVEKI